MINEFLLGISKIRTEIPYLITKNYINLSSLKSALNNLV